jgi:hypothetical protein
MLSSELHALIQQQNNPTVLKSCLTGQIKFYDTEIKISSISSALRYVTKKHSVTQLVQIITIEILIITV